VTLRRLPPWLATSAELRLPVEGDAAIEALTEEEVDLSYVLEERYRKPRAPVTAYVPFHYHRVPPRARRALARLLQRGRRPSRFPRLPFEPSVDAVRWLRGERVDWPGGRPYALLLTHDVDTGRGAALIPRVAELELELGVRSTFFVCSDHYPLDLERLARLEELGFEVGSHGYNHDNRLAFLPERERRLRLDAIARRFRPAIPLSGFRSSSLGRTPALFRSLQGCFLYDSSVPDVDLEGRGGCATVLPYRIGSLAELPITLPMDSSLLYRGEDPRRVFESWTEKLSWIRRLGGVATGVLHAEPQLGGHPAMLREFERWVAGLGGEGWITTPRALIHHLRATGFLDRAPLAAEDRAAAAGVAP
jgi:hypothetical protein